MNRLIKLRAGVGATGAGVGVTGAGVVPQGQVWEPHRSRDSELRDEGHPPPSSERVALTSATKGFTLGYDSRDTE